PISVTVKVDPSYLTLCNIRAINAHLLELGKELAEDKLVPESVSFGAIALIDKHILGLSARKITHCQKHPKDKVALKELMHCIRNPPGVMHMNLRTSNPSSICYNVSAYKFAASGQNSRRYLVEIRAHG